MSPLIRRMRSWVVTAPVGTARYWLCLSVLVSRLGVTRPARAKILLVALLMPIRDAADPRQEAAAGDVPYSRRRAPGRLARGSESDAEVLNEVLGAR